MKRQTRTELDKIVMIGMSKIDQVVNKLCDDCVAPQIKPPVSILEFGAVPDWPPRSLDGLAMLQQLASAQSSMLDQQRLAGMANNYNGCYASSGQALGFIGLGEGRFI